MNIVEAEGKTTREINTAIKALIANGASEIRVRNPGARHNLGVAIVKPVHITFEGSVGYYCGGMGDGANIEIHGSAGWGVAEGILSGTVVVERNAGNGAGAAIRGGTVVVRGDVSGRGGVSMKGGTIIVGGNAGYMSGFMQQKGTLIILGDAGPALGDSLYAGTIYVAGSSDLGNDAVEAAFDEQDARYLEATLAPFEYDSTRYNFRKIVAGRKLWNFDKNDFETWKVAL